VVQMRKVIYHWWRRERSSDDFGPPINYHGLDEGAPVDDLRQSALILYRILLRQVGEEASTTDTANAATQYCLEQGGHTRPRGQESDEPSGLCVFADDSVCDEWEFYRGECGPASDLSELSENEEQAASADVQFEALRDHYFIESLKLYPVTATYLGAAVYDDQLAKIDGQLRDTSQDARDAEVDFYHNVQDQLAAISADDLAVQNQVDFQVMQAQINFLLHQLTDIRYHERAVDTYVSNTFSGVDWQMQGMTNLGDGQIGTEGEWSLVVARLRAIPTYLENAKANLLAGKEAGNLPDRRMVQNDGIDGSQDTADYFRNVLPIDAEPMLGSRPFAGDMLAQIREAGATAAAAYEDLATFMGETYDLDETIDHFAIGEDEYAWRVSNNFQVSQSPAELYDYAAGRVAEIENEAYATAEQVAAELGLDQPFDSETEQRASTLAVIDALAEDAPKDDDQLFAWYNEVAQNLVQYGRDHDLFDIPDDYELDIVETPPLLRSAIKAAYFPAPPFKASGVGRFYLTPTDNDPATLKLNNHASIADLTAHEGFPGHDWHYKFMSQHADEISNIRWLTPGAVQDGSSMWEDSMAAEGWALYAEQLMAEPQEGAPNGFYSSAELLYELQGQLWRAARVRVDVGLHTGRMSFDEAVDYFTEHVLFYPGACAKAEEEDAKAICDQAQREIFRYSKWPTQAITYNLGKKEILELRDAYQAQQGDQYTAKTFHEKLMKMGTIPPGYYRDVFLEE